MLRRFFNVVLFILVLAALVNFHNYWKRVTTAGTKGLGWEPVKPESLSGLENELVPSYREAREEVSTLKKWLQQHENSPSLKDPRKAWIQLDYVVMVSRDNPNEARRIFAEVKNRVGPNSPVYGRVKQLEKTYE